MNPVPSIVKAQEACDEARVHLAKVRGRAQGRCKHKHGEGVRGSNTGNYDSGQDRYWIDLYCPRCQLRLHMSQDEYQRQIREGTMPRWNERI